jgi:RNA polymerase sigma-54 factor
MSLRMTVNISQRPMLVMTPKLKQAIQILQMNRLELTQHINQEMVQNPFLETSEEIDLSEDVEETKEPDEVSEMNLDVETGLPDDVNGSASGNDSPELDVTSEDFGDPEWERYFEDTFPIANNEWEAPAEDDMRGNAITVAESLAEHLLWQLRMSVESEEDYAIGEAIIGNIDNDGYLKSSVEEIAQMTEIEVSDVERLLKIIQIFEPTGVGARNLKECLLIQLQQLDLQNTVAYKIVENDLLELLGTNKLPQLAKQLSVELEVIQAAAKVISSLEPKPGRQFSSERPEYLFPDVTVEKVDGEYRVFVNDDGPNLRISPFYRTLLRSGRSEKDKEYILNNIQSAKWLIESIERRRTTILKVTESIFEVQKDFLDKGPGYIKPLTLKDIAAMVGIHEGTVSRVTKNRFVNTPRGTFSLKKFFTSSLSTTDGGETSSANVKEQIKEIIDKENPKKPLSDDEIMVKLNDRGVNIKRRTINKYRKELNIPAASKRKKW